MSEELFIRTEESHELSFARGRWMDTIAASASASMQAVRTGIASAASVANAMVCYRKAESIVI